MPVAIIQRVKSMFIENTSLGCGVVVFLLDCAALEGFVSRIPKLKLWDSWKETVSDKRASVLFVVKDERMLKEVKEYTRNWENHSIYFSFSNESSLAYTNDGPCTFIFD